MTAAVRYPDLDPLASDDGLPLVLQPATAEAEGRAVCDYASALALMERLIARPPEAADVLVVVQHPPVATLGRSGGRDSLLATQWRGREIEVHSLSRGGKVTLHAPGQLVVYPVVQLSRLEGPVGRGPLGDLPAFARLLEGAMQHTCSHFGLPTVTRAGFAGLWCDEVQKIGSLGVAVHNGWSWHGLALNIDPDLAFFELMVPCGIAGAQMTSLQAGLAARGLPAPTVAEAGAVLVDWLRPRLRRRAGGQA